MYHIRHGEIYMYYTSSLLITLILVTGVLCQSFSSPSGVVCPGVNVTFMCVVEDTIATRWSVDLRGDESQCAYFSDSPATDTCGPDNRFQSSRTNDNVPASNSSLRVDTITTDLNGTAVTCSSGNGELIGSYNICIIGEEKLLCVTLTIIQLTEYLSAPEFLPVTIYQGDVGVDECVVNVVWSEPFISCSGSVSQYVLSVTPPTSDCGSGSEDCVLVTDQTHYDLTLTVDQTYNLTVRADTCTNTLTGDYSDPLSINTG